jgi:hypothetical protein
MAACNSLASDGKMFLGCTVAKSLLRNARLSCATRRRSASSSSSLPKMKQLEHQALIMHYGSASNRTI